MEEFPDEVFGHHDPADVARRLGMPFGRAVSNFGNLQQVPKDIGLVKKLFTEPDPKWQLVEFDSSDAGFGRETRVVVHKSATPGLSLPVRRWMLAGGRRAGRQATINAALAFAAGQPLGEPFRLPALGLRRRTKVSAAVRSALEHWASAN